MSWYKASGWSKDNDRWYTKFMKGLNWAFNPNHEWFDYDSWNENSTMNKIEGFLKNATETVGTAISGMNAGDQLQSFINSQTGAHLTGSQVEANEMQMQNQEDIYQRQVAGMQKAGLNPALMYQSGVTSAPSVQGSQGVGSMSEIMQALLLDRQAKLLDSQTRNVDADTDKKAAETENMQLINKYYPEVTDTQIKKILSQIGVDAATISKIDSEIDINNLQEELMKSEKVIKEAEADNASEYYKWRVEYEKAQTDEAKKNAGLHAVQAAMARLEKDYMAHTNTKMGSNSLVVIAAALGTLLSNFNLSLDDVKGFKDKLKDWIDKPKYLIGEEKDYQPGGKYYYGD